MAQGSAESDAQFEQALVTAQASPGIVPICADCKSIRDREGQWLRLESYVSQHTKLMFSHGLCDDCVGKR